MKTDLACAWIVIILPIVHCQGHIKALSPSALSPTDNSCYDLEAGLISLEPLKYESLSEVHIYSKEDRLHSFVGYPCNTTMYKEYEQKFQRHLYTCPFHKDLQPEFELYKTNTIKNHSIHFQSICFSNQFEKCVRNPKANNDSWCDGICQCIYNMEIEYPPGTDAKKNPATQILEHHKLCGVQEGGACVPTWKSHHKFIKNGNVSVVKIVSCESNRSVEHKYKRWIREMMLPCERNAMCRMDKKVCECAVGYRCRNKNQGNLLTFNTNFILWLGLIVTIKFDKTTKVLIFAICTLPSVYSQQFETNEEIKGYVDPSCLPGPGLLSLEPLQYKHLSQVKIYSKEDRLNSFVGYPCNTTLYKEYHEMFQRHLYMCPFDQDLETTFQIYKRGTIRPLEIHFQAICFSNQFEECIPHPDNKTGQWCDGICSCIPELEMEFPNGVKSNSNGTAAIQVEEQGKLCGVLAGGVCVPGVMDDDYNSKATKKCNTTWSMRNNSNELSITDFLMPCEWNAMCRPEKKTCECAMGRRCNAGSLVALDKLLILVLISTTLASNGIYL